jgi:hypothetical protein
MPGQPGDRVREVTAAERIDTRSPFNQFPINDS